MGSSKAVNGVGQLVPPHSLFPYRPVSAALAITPSVSVVIPALNEARNIPHVFATLPWWVDEVVLVDGHSTDDTVAVARGIRPDIKVVTQQGAGKGDALLAGFAACTGDIIVMIDGDGSTDGSEIVLFVSALVAGADFAKGSRFASGGRSDDITVGRRYGNRMLNVLVNRMFGTHYTDLCYGYNAVWARHLGAMAVDFAGFEVETLMSIRSAHASAATGVRPVPAPGGGPDISVVICAHTEQRWADTLAAVASVRAQSLAAREIIVVVDHNPVLLGRLRAALGDVTVVENRAGRGLSGGKNTGVAVARGEIVAFLDD